MVTLVTFACSISSSLWHHKNPHVRSMVVIANHTDALATRGYPLAYLGSDYRRCNDMRLSVLDQCGLSWQIEATGLPLMSTTSTSRLCSLALSIKTRDGLEQ